MNEVPQPIPGFYMSFSPHTRDLSYDIALPSETSPKWMEKVLGLVGTFDLFPPMISGIEVCHHSGMPEFIVEQIREYHKFMATKPDLYAQKKYYGAVSTNIHRFALTAVYEKFAKSPGKETDLVLIGPDEAEIAATFLKKQPNDSGSILVGQDEVNMAAMFLEKPPNIIADLVDLFEIGGVSSMDKRIATITAFHNLGQIGHSLFMLLTGTRRSLFPDQFEQTVPISFREEFLFGKHPFSFLSAIAYLITAYDTAISHQSSTGQQPISAFQSYLLENQAQPILNAITTIEFAETKPDIEETHKAHCMSLLSQLMVFLSDMYFTEKLIAHHIPLPPMVVDPGFKKKILNMLTGKPELREGKIHHSYEGLDAALKQAGLLDTSVMLSLLNRFGKVSIEDTFKSGFRIYMDHHDRFVNYASQLRNMNPAADVTDLLAIYPQLLDAKLTRPEGAWLAANHKLYLKSRNFLKYRFVLPDGKWGFDEMVRSVIRDIVDDGHAYDESMIARLGHDEFKAWSDRMKPLIETKAAARDRLLNIHLRKFFTLYVSDTGLTDVIPFDKQNIDFYRKMIDQTTSPTDVITQRFKQGGRAMIFVQFIMRLPVGSGKYLEIPIELQMVPQSVENQLYQQRTDYLMDRFYGYKGTPKFFEELLKKMDADQHIDPYVV